MARLYANENFALPVVLELRRLGHDVLTTHEAGRSDQSIPDEEVLQFASDENRAVLTLNRKHFIRLHRERAEHQGIIVCTYDPKFASQSVRIHAAIQEQFTLSGKLLRVHRPANQQKHSIMTNITLRRAERGDAQAVIGLIIALAEFENLPPPDAEAQARLIEHGFGDQPKFEVLLAEAEGAPDPVGYALLLQTYSTFLARPSLYLEDVFVLPDYRKRGIGKRLLRESVRLAHTRGCGRMEWSCLDWNTNAQALYERMGARRMKEWYLYRMTRDAMAKMLEEDEGSLGETDV